MSCMSLRRIIDARVYTDVRYNPHTNDKCPKMPKIRSVVTPTSLVSNPHSRFGASDGSTWSSRTLRRARQVLYLSFYSLQIEKPRERPPRRVYEKWSGQLGTGRTGKPLVPRRAATRHP